MRKLRLNQGRGLIDFIKRDVRNCAETGREAFSKIYCDFCVNQGKAWNLIKYNVFSDITIILFW